MTVICKQHKRQDDVICQLHEASWLLSVSYMGQVIGVCQLHEAGRLFSVNYMEQVIGVCQLHEAG